MSRIGFTNGCFDWFHPGHYKFLELCSNYCDLLIVGLNSDESVKKLKGRLVYPYDIRKEILMNTGFVSNVYEFSSNEELVNLMKRVNPMYVFKGSDYKENEVISIPSAKVILIPRYEDWSTTKMVSKSGMQNEHT